jgi:hypothetical protein
MPTNHEPETPVDPTPEPQNIAFCPKCLEFVSVAPCSPFYTLDEVTEHLAFPSKDALKAWLLLNKHLLNPPRYAYGPTGRRYRLLDAQEVRTIRDNKRFTWRGVLKWAIAA